MRALRFPVCRTQAWGARRVARRLPLEHRDEVVTIDRAFLGRTAALPQFRGEIAHGRPDSSRLEPSPRADSVPTRVLAALANARTTQRRWLLAVLVVGVAAVSAWLSLTFTPPGEIKLGV